MVRQAFVRCLAALFLLAFALSGPAFPARATVDVRPTSLYGEPAAGLFCTAGILPAASLLDRADGRDARRTVGILPAARLSVRADGRDARRTAGILPAASLLDRADGRDARRTVGILPAARLSVRADGRDARRTAGILPAALRIGERTEPMADYLWQAEAESGQVVAPMAVRADGAACGGQYVSSADGFAGQVSFSLSVPQAGNYFLWARAKGDQWTGNSFSVAFDGAESIVYEIPPFEEQWVYGWDRVHWVDHPEDPFWLEAGAHTLYFRGREANAALDMLLLTSDAGYVPIGCSDSITATPSPTGTRTRTPTPGTPATGYTWRAEGESGQVMAPMAVRADGAACGGRYVSSADPNAGQVSFSLSVPQAGNYFLWARARGAGWAENSFSVAFDGSEPIVYEIPPFGEQWVFGWDRVHWVDHPEDPFSLGAGTHTLYFRGREANAALDELLLTSDGGYVPSGCVITPTPSPTPSVSPTPSATPTPSMTPTPTATPTPSATATFTPTPWRARLPVLLRQPAPVEAYYDDGTCEGYHRWRAAAVRFTVAGRRQVAQLQYYLKGQPGPVQLVVYDANWAVLFKTSVSPGPLDATQYRWYSYDIGPGLAVGPGDFYVALVWPSAGAEPYLGEDTTAPHAGRSYGSWTSASPPFPLIEAPPMDLMIRVWVR